MPAKLLEFYGLSMNKDGVTYYLMTHNKLDTLECEMNLDTIDDPEFKIGGVLFGAQYSMVIRNVVKSAIHTKGMK
jgi:hypothetical protein